jgi:hypothetical protein
MAPIQLWWQEEHFSREEIWLNKEIVRLVEVGAFDIKDSVPSEEREEEVQVSGGFARVNHAFDPKEVHNRGAFREDLGSYNRLRAGYYHIPIAEISASFDHTKSKRNHLLSLLAYLDNFIILARSFQEVHSILALVVRPLFSKLGL